jgi:biopolymer transport protein ExbB/TolQ
MDYQELELHHRRLIENPTDPTSFAVLRDFFAQSGQNAQLAELYEFRAGNLADPRERAEHLLQAALVWLDRENNRPRGQRDLEEAFRVHPTHEAIGDKLEEVYRADQNLGALTQLITQRILSVEQLGEIPETARLRGRLYQNLGEIKERVENDPKEAIRCYKRAYAIDPSNVLALYLAREIYRRAGDMRSASKLYELEIKSEPTAQRQVALLRELATLRAEQLQDLDGAVEALVGRLTLDDDKMMRHSSIYHIYHIGASEIAHRLSRTETGSARMLSGPSIAAIRASLDAGLLREIQKLNRMMVVLTIAISGGPFLGLLGTVVGVMITFAAIAASGDVNVNAIAPGIAAALVATVAGLGVAIPALFGYNYLISRIKDLTGDMQVFVDEFVTKMAEFYSERPEHPKPYRVAAE